MKSKSAWWFVPALYFQQGLPGVLVQQTSVILCKKMGLSNTEIGLWTSAITWPWVIKWLWAPKVDCIGTKRDWVFWMQLGIVFGLALVAGTLGLGLGVITALVVLSGVAFLSATHDVALDGYYMASLETNDQAFFSGVRNTFYRLSMIFCSGVLVVAAGQWEASGTSIALSWMRVFAYAALIYAAVALYCFWASPRNERRLTFSQSQVGHFQVLKEFFDHPDVIWILAFILFFRFSEAMLVKMAAPFLLDSVSLGGLGLTTTQVGMILGNLGAASLVAGGILGGVAISKWGLKKCIWPMALVMNFPNLLYVWASTKDPGVLGISVVTVFEQFGYGFGMSALLVFALYVAQRSQFKASHYAVISGFMFLGVMIAGMVSGWLQAKLGYTGFFSAVCVFALPGILLIKKIPLTAPVPQRP